MKGAATIKLVDWQVETVKVLLAYRRDFLPGLFQFGHVNPGGRPRVRFEIKLGPGFWWPPTVHFADPVGDSPRHILLTD